MRPLGTHWQTRTQGLNKERSITRPVPGYRPEIYFRIFKDLSLAFFLSEFELINSMIRMPMKSISCGFSWSKIIKPREID